MLFNLETDIEEKSDVADENPAVVERLSGYAEKAREELGDWNNMGRDQKSPEKHLDTQENEKYSHHNLKHREIHIENHFNY